MICLNSRVLNRTASVQLVGPDAGDRDDFFLLERRYSSRHVKHYDNRPETAPHGTGAIPRGRFYNNKPPAPAPPGAGRRTSRTISALSGAAVEIKRSSMINAMCPRERDTRTRPRRPAPVHRWYRCRCRYRCYSRIAQGNGASYRPWRPPPRSRPLCAPRPARPLAPCPRCPMPSPMAASLPLPSSISFSSSTP